MICFDLRGSIITNSVTMSASSGIPVSKNFKKFYRMLIFTNVLEAVLGTWFWMEFLQQIAKNYWNKGEADSLFELKRIFLNKVLIRCK